MSPLLEQALVAAHLLSAAAWFGALVYRAFFVDPKAVRFFGWPGDYEQFALHQAHGMRYVVLTALLVCGLSGAALLWPRLATASPAWLALMGLKVVLWAVSFTVFAYVSWVFWPRRVFAAGPEYPTFRRQGRVLALTMVALAGLGLLLGQAGQALRHQGGPDSAPTSAVAVALPGR